MIQDAPCVAPRLVPEAKLFDECSVRGQVAALEIREEPAAGADHLQQPSAAVMVLGVGPEVIRQGIDPLGEQGNLYLGGPGVLLVGLMLGRHSLLVEAHAA
jgi:hypothetical protein